MKIRVIGLFIFLVCSITSFSQLSEYTRFQNIETHQFGYTSILDQKWMEDGSFWAITEQGLLHHNGYNGIDFTPTADSEGTVVSSNIFHLNKISEDEIWISYKDTNVLTLLNPQTSEFSHYTVDEILQDGKQLSIIVKVLKDQNGQIWLCTWGTGLIKWSKTGEGNEVYIFNNENPKNKEVGKYVKDIWINDDNTIFVTFFYEYTKRGSYPGIFNSETEEFRRIDLPKIINENTSNKKLKAIYKTGFKIVHFVYRDDKGNYWVGSYTGLYFLDLENNVIKRIDQNKHEELIANSVNVTSYIVTNNQLWIATHNMGVMVVDIKSQKSVFHLSDPSNYNSIYSNRVKSISIDPQHNIWIANGSGTFSVYAPFVHNFKVFYWKDMDLDYSNRSAQRIPVNQLLVKNSRNVYVSSELGVLKLDYHTMKTSRNYRIDHVASSGALKKGLSDMKILGEDSLFVIHDVYPAILNTKSGNIETHVPNKHYRHIAFRHEPKVKEMFLMRNYYQSDEIAINRYNWDKAKEEELFRTKTRGHVSSQFAFVTNENKWILSEQFGRFMLLDTADKSFHLFSPSKKESHFPDSTVNCVLVQDTGKILIGTSKDLYRFDENTFEYENISDEIGLKKGEGVYSMIEQDNNRLWLATNNEMLCWNKSEGKTIRYGKKLGVDVSNFLPAVGQKDELGNFYFAAMYGILVFNPEDLQRNENDFEIGLSLVKVNENKLSKQEQSALLVGRKKFHWNDNFLEFYFHSNQVYQLSPHTYQYKLKGLNEKWVKNGVNNYIRFDNLQYGEYELLFKGVNAYGKESNVIRVPFIIEKPFWFRWWFYALIVIVIIITVYLSIKVRVRALKKRSKLLEEKVEERTAEVVEQKHEADRQREMVEEKQQEITDSINYAKRIQEAIMPNLLSFKKHLPESFILYKPKDIVAGDFYWMESPEKHPEVVIYAAADCTGHGVPGAMVSVVCNNALNRAVREFGLIDPGAILDKTRELVIEQFENGALENVSNVDLIKDGMDISLCYLDKKSKHLKWAGANNPLWILRDEEIIQIKGDKQPIGKYENATAFTTHEVDLQEGDEIVVFSDGYADQFGGEKGKKMKSKAFKNLLLEMSNQSMDEQSKLLNKAFESWKGDYEQLDDVCVIGVRV